VSAISLSGGATSLYISDFDGQVWSTFFSRAKWAMGDLVRVGPPHVRSIRSDRRHQHGFRWH
jgi:hypothetical protein